MGAINWLAAVLCGGHVGVGCRGLCMRWFGRFYCFGCKLGFGTGRVGEGELV
jgi:hypothetical protein